jgi:hypothetical protein
MSAVRSRPGEPFKTVAYNTSPLYRPLKNTILSLYRRDTLTNSYIATLLPRSQVVSTAGYARVRISPNSHDPINRL